MRRRIQSARIQRYILNCSDAQKLKDISTVSHRYLGSKQFCINNISAFFKTILFLFRHRETSAALRRRTMSLQIYVHKHALHQNMIDIYREVVAHAVQWKCMKDRCVLPKSNSQLYKKNLQQVFIDIKPNKHPL